MLLSYENLTRNHLFLGSGYGSIQLTVTSNFPRYANEKVKKELIDDNNFSVTFVSIFYTFWRLK